MNKTYRVLIVEDEEIESKALTMMLRYNRKDIGEIETAANGVQALEIYKTFSPDIVLMDINLPGINGLEVIRQMQYLPGNFSAVIVSAHSQFAYAREAMRLGVQDFLIKPIQLEDINRVLDEVIRQIEKKQSHQDIVQYQRARMAEIRPILERDCILSIASLRSDTPLASLFDFMQIHITSGFVFVVRGEGIGNPVLREIKARIHNMGMSCIGEIINGICVCVALSDRKISAAEIQEVMQLLAKRLQLQKHGCHLGVGTPADSADDLRRSYEQAIVNNYAEEKRSPGNATAAAPGEPLPNVLSSVTEEAVKIVRSIRAGNAAGLTTQVKSFFSSFQEAASYRQLQEAAYWLYIMVIGNFPEYASDVKPLTSARIFATQDAVALCNTLTEAFMSLIELQDDVGNAQPNQIVAKAMHIVKHRFQEDLTLDSVAEELNISLFYLSKLFRKNKGISFTEYLTQVRLEHAKKLLEEGQKCVKEVAYATGFNSQSYFSKVFKKYTGKSPSEYHGPSD